MSYFPFFVDIKDKDIIIAGGGSVSLRKIKKLLPFGCRITVISPYIFDEIFDLSRAYKNLFLKEKEISEQDIKEAFAVVAATDNKELNSKISSWCKELNILINVVDDAELCSFIFPSLISDNENLSIGISTNAKAPEFAPYLRERMEKSLPESYIRMIEHISSLRQKLRYLLQEHQNRAYVMRKLLEFAEKKDFCVDYSELEQYMLKLIENI